MCCGRARSPILPTPPKARRRSGRLTQRSRAMVASTPFFCPSPTGFLCAVNADLSLAKGPVRADALPRMVDEPIELFRGGDRPAPRNSEMGDAPPPAARERVEQVMFDRKELSSILGVYGRKVAEGEWRDYAIG